MDLKEFKKSLTAPHPPENSSVYLQSLWYEANGNWDKAHILIQDVNDENAAWIHAYLHRKEGDEGNAAYWYHRAERNLLSRYNKNGKKL